MDERIEQIINFIPKSLAKIDALGCDDLHEQSELIDRCVQRLDNKFEWAQGLSFLDLEALIFEAVEEAHPIGVGHQPEYFGGE